MVGFERIVDAHLGMLEKARVKLEPLALCFGGNSEGR